MESIIRAIEIYPDRVRLLDQRKLPLVEEYVECYTYQEVAEAIRTMVVRGAPAIGVAAAGGVALGVQNLQSGSPEVIAVQFETICTTLAQTRPTAVNLFWAIDRMRTRARQYQGTPLSQLQQALQAEARRLLQEDIDINRRIGVYGLPLVPPGSTILTHCNAGALANAAYVTALGVIRAAHFAGRHVQVFDDDTRPVLDGARLTTCGSRRAGNAVPL